jgi:VanZ family protein
MKTRPSNRQFAIGYVAPLLTWLSLIYFFSTDNFSSGQTSRFIEPLLKFLFPAMSAASIEFWHSVARKCGHISEYFVLAVLTYRALQFDAPDHFHTAIRTFAFVILIAVTDEVHQTFTMYRGASIVDVGYDCLGGSIAMLLATVLRK